jgi:hypothetical protein
MLHAIQRNNEKYPFEKICKDILRGFLEEILRRGPKGKLKIGNHMKIVEI